MTRYQQLCMEFDRYAELIAEMMTSMEERGYDMFRVQAAVLKTARRTPEKFGDITGRRTLTAAYEHQRRTAARESERENGEDHQG